jgi:hypothetical protein
VLTLAEADAELQRLNLLKKNHMDEQYVARRSVRDLPETIASLSDRLSKLTADQATATAHADDPITLAERKCQREEVSAVLGGQLEALPENVLEPRRIPLGTYRGLKFGMLLQSQFAPGVYLEGVMTQIDTLSRDHHGPRAVLNALERLVNGYASESARVRQELTIAESQLRDYKARLGKPFQHDAYLTELTSLRDQLKVGLSATAHEPDNEKGPSVSEPAEKIKSLKAAHSIDPMPQRVRQKQSTAEEPVTARIRRRTEATSPLNQQTESDATPQTDAAQKSASPENSAAEPEITFQERIAIERQRNSEGPPGPPG